jgi:hypothetical protein
MIGDEVQDMLYTMDDVKLGWRTCKRHLGGFPKQDGPFTSGGVIAKIAKKQLSAARGRRTVEEAPLGAFSCSRCCGDKIWTSYIGTEVRPGADGCGENNMA